MKRILRMPPELDGKIIEKCWDCPFFGFGDDGWDYCNLKVFSEESYRDHFDPDIEICPLPETKGSPILEREDDFREAFCAMTKDCGACWITHVLSVPCPIRKYFGPPRRSKT